MKQIYKYSSLLVLFVSQTISYSQNIPTTEAEFVNPVNFPIVPGDAMVPSRTNYYRMPSGYDYHKNPDGSMYLTEGEYGSAMVDNQLRLIKLITRSNYNSISEPYPEYVINSSNQSEDIFFRLYTGLKLVEDNPTPSTSDSHLKTLRKSTTNESFPYFNSYPNTASGDLVYNWQSWLYPTSSGVKNVNPKTANDNRDNYYKGKNYVYRDYNYLTLRDTDPSNDLTDNSLDQNFELNLSNNPANATKIYTRINTLRDKLILSLWVGYRPLYTTSSKPLTDLRISGWNDTYDIKYKVWFNGVAAVEPNGFSNEYLKIYEANNLFNSQNLSGGETILNFNNRFDELADIAEDMTSQSTEAAMELIGKRVIDYSNDKDSYGSTKSTLQLKFRMLTVGMEYNDTKIYRRYIEPSFTTLERIFGQHQPYYNFLLNNNINVFHPTRPFALSKEHYIDIETTRPVLKFPTAETQSGNLYKGTPVVMNQGDTNVLQSIAFEIIEDTNAYLPYQELLTAKQVAQIQSDRVRVSLIKKTVYDQYIANVSTATGYDAVNNPVPNNDLPTLNNFSYLSQQDFIDNQQNIPAGNYYIKYDYSSPDSNSQIKSVGSGLGNVFAKPVYRPLEVKSIHSGGFINPNLRHRSTK